MHSFPFYWILFVTHAKKKPKNESNEFAEKANSTPMKTKQQMDELALENGEKGQRNQLRFEYEFLMCIKKIVATDGKAFKCK